MLVLQSSQSSDDDLMIGDEVDGNVEFVTVMRGKPVSRRAAQDTGLREMGMVSAVSTLTGVGPVGGRKARKPKKVTPAEVVTTFKGIPLPEMVGVSFSHVTGEIGSDFDVWVDNCDSTIILIVSPIVFAEHALDAQVSAECQHWEAGLL